MVYSFTFIALLVTILFLLSLTVVAWRFRDNPGAKLFGVLQALSAIWAGLTLVGLQLPPSALQLQVWGLQTGMSLIVVAVWFAFILSYTGREHFLTPRRFGVASVPLLIGALLYAIVPSWHPLVGHIDQRIIPAGSVVQASVGPVGGILGLYIYLVFLVGLILVIKRLLEGSSLFVGQAMALVLGSLVTIVASFLGIIGIPVSGYPITEVALGGQSLLWGYAVFGKRFLQAVPAVAAIGERVVFEELDDGVVVVDGKGTVVQANASAHEYLDLTDLGGESVKSILDRIGIAALAELPARFQMQGQTYRAKTSSVTNWREEAVGQAVVIQDISSLVRRQQRLQVLNRILRHNVRNDMNVVRGMGEQLQGRSDDELVNIGETVYECADDLMAVSDKALELDRVFDSRTTVEGVSVDALVEDVVSSLAAQHPAAVINTDVSAETVRTDARMLSLVMEELLTNALEHAGDAPEVRIGVSRRTDHIEVSVTDDGPGIPREEIDPIIDGEETDLEHASSLGLWLVCWGIHSLDGDVDITTTDGGTTVTLSVPDTEATGATRPANRAD